MLLPLLALASLAAASLGQAAQASPRLDCATPAALDALRGRGPAPHRYALLPPDRLGDDLPPPPGSGREIYGSPYDLHLETEHFTINWWNPGIATSDVISASEALENAWDALVDTQGWTPPVSSDRYYIWVLLDPSLGSTTGYTTEYFTELYPQGYPVIYLNPDWAWDDAFWASLAAHEFSHSLQFALRDWDESDEGETWYWEASATWSSELADPDVDGHQYTSEWYATQPSLRFDSTTGSHQYGMFVFNAWLEEYVTGPGGMLAVWELSADRPGSAWDEILAESTGTDAGQLWAGFTGAYGNNELEESALYTEPVTVGALVEGSSGSLLKLGTHYWEVEDDVLVTAEGNVLLGTAGGTSGSTGTVIEAFRGDRLAVTAQSNFIIDYRLTLEEIDGGDGGATGDGGADGGADGDPPSGDGGTEDDGGSAASGDGGAGDDGGSAASDSGSTSTGVDTDDPKSGCSTLPRASLFGLGWLLLALPLRRRAR